MAEWARRGRAINTDGAHSRASTASTTASRADRKRLEHVDRRVLRRVDVCSGPLGRGAYGIVWKGVERRGSRRPVVERRLHAVDATRVHLTMKWVVFLSILSQFIRVETAIRAGAGNGAS